MEIIRTNDVKLTAQAVWGPSDPIRPAAGWKRHDGFLEPKPLSTWISTWIQDVEWMQIVICRCDRWDRRRYMDPAWLRVVPSMPEAIPIDYIPGTPTPCMALGHKVLQYHRTEWGHWNCCEWRRTGITHRLHSGIEMPFPDVLMQKFNRHIFTLFKSAQVPSWHDLPWQASGLGDGLWTGGRPMPRIFLHSQFLGPSSQEYFQPSHFYDYPD